MLLERVIFFRLEKKFFKFYFLILIKIVKLYKKRLFIIRMFMYNIIYIFIGGIFINNFKKNILVVLEFLICLRIFFFFMKFDDV